MIVTLKICPHCGHKFRNLNQHYAQTLRFGSLGCCGQKAQYKSIWSQK